MDLARVVELERAVRDTVQQKVDRLVIFEAGGPTIHYGRSLNVGLDYCIVKLASVRGSSRHRFVVETANIKSKSFRETRAGWFSVDRIADHIVDVIDQEAERRGERTRAVLRIRSTQGRIKHLKAQRDDEAGNLSRVEMQPNQHDGSTIDVTIRGLTEPQTALVLAAIHCAVASPDATVFTHLLEEDE